MTVSIQGDVEHVRILWNFPPAFFSVPAKTLSYTPDSTMPFIISGEETLDGPSTGWIEICGMAISLPAVGWVPVGGITTGSLPRRGVSLFGEVKWRKPTHTSGIRDTCILCSVSCPVTRVMWAWKSSTMREFWLDSTQIVVETGHAGKKEKADRFSSCSQVRLVHTYKRRRRACCHQNEYNLMSWERYWKSSDSWCENDVRRHPWELSNLRKVKQQHQQCSTTHQGITVHQPAI